VIKVLILGVPVAVNVHMQRSFEFLGFQSGAVEAFFLLGLAISILEDENTMLSVNLTHPPPSDMMPHPRRTKTST
jgi:hypothetical protein